MCCFLLGLKDTYPKDFFLTLHRVIHWENIQVVTGRNFQGKSSVFSNPISVLIWAGYRLWTALTSLPSCTVSQQSGEVGKARRQV